MTVAVILRLLGGNLAQGRVVGRAEIVDTGETFAFRDEQEMVAFILRSASTVAIGPRGAPPALHGEHSAGSDLGR